jgi:2-oxoglutarate dehydrogenase E2 component (dihydrolipoamide succinyltransferase)
MILDVVIPNVAESITEVTLGTWLVKDGDYVIIDQPLCEVETDKASQELIAEKAGQIKLLVSEGDDVKVGGLIAKIDTSAAAPAKNSADETKQDTAQQQKEVKSEKIIDTIPQVKHYASSTPSPSAQKMIVENNLDVFQISGTGKDDRIKIASHL